MYSEGSHNSERHTLRAQFSELKHSNVNLNRLLKIAVTGFSPPIDCQSFYHTLCLFLLVYCNKSCARGRLDTVLCQCRCPQSVIQGRVVSSSGASLRDVSIFWDFPPHTEMTKTSQNGHFTVKDNCESLSFSVTKKGYIPYRSDTGRLPDTRPVLIRLEDAGVLYTISLSFPSLLNISFCSTFHYSRCWKTNITTRKYCSIASAQVVKYEISSA